MKPISVRFKCFGPYMEEQTVDFEKLRHGKASCMECSPH